MSEREQAYLLANKLLDEPNADPDDDLRVLARQLLRHRERAEFGVEAMATSVVCVNLVGFSDKGPTEPNEYGNCFSVTIDGKETRVVNFNHENLEKLVAVLTDSETWASNIQPTQALAKYRQRSGIPAKLIVVGMTATEFSIADTSDAGMLDVVGFDTATPTVMTDFVR